MRRLWPYLLLIAFAVVHVIAVGKLTRGVNVRTVTENPLYVLPSPIMKVASLDLDGVVSDFLFIEAMVHIGSNIQYQGNVLTISFSEPQWKWFHGVMDASSDLDPYFVDPYYVGNSFLAWDAGMIQEANALLEKGSRYRDWDWTLPFFLGFNQFYFLQDNEKAAEYLMEASRRPDASPVLASLASKLAFKANKTENSILFLEEIIKETEDESTKKLFEARLEAFKAISLLERAVHAYQARFKRAPRNVEELVKKNIIAELPKDPYGGKYSIDSQGKVKTTSENLLMPYLNKK